MFLDYTVLVVILILVGLVMTLVFSKILHVKVFGGPIVMIIVATSGALLGMYYFPTLEALMQNKIDIADAPMDSLLQHKLHKVAPYLTDANHLFSRACITINESVFQSLNSNFQEALTLAANKVGDLFSKKISKSYAKDEEKVLEEKGCIIRINTRKFQQKVDQFLVNESTKPDFPFEVYKYIKEKL